MIYLIGFVVLTLLSGTLAACAAMLMKRYAPAMGEDWRRRLAPFVGAFAVMSPAFAKASHMAGVAALVWVLAIAVVLAIIGGIPAVRWFEGPRKP